MAKKLKPLIRSGGIYPTEGITPLVRGNGFMKNTDNSKGEAQEQAQETPQTATEAATIEESKGN